TGVTLWIAIGSVALVLGSGAVALVTRGAGRGPVTPVLPRPAAMTGTGTLVLIAAALAAAVAALLHVPSSGLLLIAIAGALAVAGVFAARALGPATDSTPGPATDSTPGRAAPAAADQPARPDRASWRALALAAVLGLVAIRAYTAVIRFDWPYVRGGDQFSYAVMAEQMLSHGSYGTFMIYPPGFSTLTAVICRL